jgi:hypothetical protein
VYLLEDFVDIGVVGEWKSPVHRNVAIAVCIARPECKTMEVLKANIAIVQGMTEEECLTATTADMVTRGCIF